MAAPPDVEILSFLATAPAAASVGLESLTKERGAHKVAGELARQGKPLGAVAEAAGLVAGSLATMGVSASPCVVPGRSASFQLPDGKVGEHRIPALLLSAARFGLGFFHT